CMFLNDSVRYRKTQPSCARLAFPRSVFGGEERIVNTLDVLLRDAYSGVRDSHAHARAIPGLDPQPPTSRHCVLGVQEEIEKYLLQLAPVAVDERQAVQQIRFHCHSSNF